MKKLLFTYLLVLAGISAQLEVGARCGPKNKRQCVLVTDCVDAIELMKVGKPHGMERCGLKGETEIVCCEQQIVGSKLPVRKSAEACTKYSKGSQVGVQEFILQGINASLGEFPHMAALGFDNGTGGISWGECGGSLINEKYVLTAAHCIVRIDGKLPIMVRLGKVDIFGNEDNVDPQDIQVAENIPYPQYNHLEKLNDIALIRLAKPAQFTNYVNPICLYTESDVPVGLVVTGWGVTQRSGNDNRFLLRALAEPVEQKKCNETFFTSPAKKTIHDSQMCALSGADLPSDTCLGDSGGPIQAANRKAIAATPFSIVGVMSFARGCGKKDTPSVYTRVSSYVLWIEDVVWPSTI